MMWGIIGGRIRKLRRKQKLSREQFGKLVGLSGQYLGLVERGARGLSVDSIVKICNTTGASADHILFGAIDFTDDPTIGLLHDLSDAQIEIILQMVKQVALFVSTEDGNEVLIRAVAGRHCLPIETEHHAAEQ